MFRIVSLLAVAIVLYLVLHDSSPVVASLNATRIDQILSSPRAFEGKSVTITGVVTGGVGVMGVGGFHVRDPDRLHEIFVISGSGVPAAGVTVTLTGVFRQAVTAGLYQLPVIILKP